MSFKPRQSLPMNVFYSCDAPGHRFVLENLEIGDRSGTPQRVSRKRMTMKESPGTVLVPKRRVYLFCANCCCKRHEAAGQSLGEAHHVWNDAGVFTSKHPARTAESRKDFVSNKEDIVLGAHAAIVAQEFRRVHEHSSGALNEGLDDHSCDLAMPRFEQSLKVRRAANAQKWNAEFVECGREWRIRADRHRADRIAVICVL